ncbi:SSI family serine proteinase inhibitor [Arthrobacter sp. NPDC093125]|uniref:SSI family serine proteinase inhibitor n=1 Tax=Arthrobacter sp. NPDC093125 TaxID=3363944 RepID=UPI0037FAC35C
MRKQFLSVLLALGAMGGLAACTPGTGTGEPTPTTGTASEAPTTPGSTSTPAEPENTQPGTAAPATTTPGTTPPDAETTDPAPAPPVPAPLPSGPGKGEAELAITVKPSQDATAVSYTLVCKEGAPAAESQHPGAAAACAALKENAAILNEPGPRKDVSCTQQYGGPQVATVTGVVDGIPVERTFMLRNGCEIGAWNAAKDVLGSAGGAV